jgi:predicted alpha/beta superfamily hydrolase
MGSARPAYVRPGNAVKRHCVILVSALMLGSGATDAVAETTTADAHVTVFAPPLRFPHLGFPRTLRVHTPHGYADRPDRYPVIYLFDGQNLFDAATSYGGEWGVDESMDALARDAGFAAIVVGIDHGGSLRVNELTPYWNLQLAPTKGAAFVRDLVESIKPFIDANYRTRAGRENTAIIGSSLGGLSADYAIHAHSDVFGLAGVLSPSYWVSENPFLIAASTPLPPGSRVYLSMGGREGPDSVRQVRRMARILRAYDADGVELRVYPQAGHNEAAWRAEFPRAVRWLFALPAEADR